MAIHFQRREVISLLGGSAVAWPLAARAQQSGRIREIVIWMGRPNDGEGQRQYIANPTSAQIRYAIRRLRRKAPEAFILVSMIGGADNVSCAEELHACQADDVRRSLSETIDQIKNLARGGKGANDPTGDSLVSKAG